MNGVEQLGLENVAVVSTANDLEGDYELHLIWGGEREGNLTLVDAWDEESHRSSRDAYADAYAYFAKRHPRVEETTIRMDYGAIRRSMGNALA